MENNNLFKETLVLKGNPQIKTKSRFAITMKNYYLNGAGNVYKIQKLCSKYQRSIKGSIPETIYFFNYLWESMHFTNKLPKKPVNEIEWTFIKEANFDSYMGISNKKLKKLCEEENINLSENYYKRGFHSIEAAYRNFPKLPSSYLVIMQTFDIITFEKYMSYIYMQSENENGWKMNHWVSINPSGLEFGREAKIGLGMYSNNSYFKNGIIKMRLSGYTCVMGKMCALFDYYCDFSKVEMMDAVDITKKRRGTSYFFGQLYIDIKSGDMLQGTMEENYFAIQESKVNKNINIKRRILCETLKG